MDYTDTQLEKLYIFARFLAKQLPRECREEQVSIDDDLALRYYRLEQSETGDISLGKTAGEVSSPTETGTRSQDDDEVALSQLVARINEALGTDFPAADELFLQQVKEDALDDDDLKQAAQVNSRSNFSYAFDERLTELFMERMDENLGMFKKYMNDDEFQDLITDILRETIYEEHQEE